CQPGIANYLSTRLVYNSTDRVRVAGLFSDQARDGGFRKRRVFLPVQLSEGLPLCAVICAEPLVCSRASALRPALALGSGALALAVGGADRSPCLVVRQRQAFADTGFDHVFDRAPLVAPGCATYAGGKADGSGDLAALGHGQGR